MTSARFLDQRRPLALRPDGWDACSRTITCPAVYAGAQSLASSLAIRRAGICSARQSRGLYVRSGGLTRANHTSDHLASRAPWSTRGRAADVRDESLTQRSTFECAHALSQPGSPTTGVTGMRGGYASILCDAYDISIDKSDAMVVGSQLLRLRTTLAQGHRIG